MYQRIFVAVFLMFACAFLGLKVLNGLSTENKIYCNDNGRSVKYCQYEGRVKSLYLNKEGLLLVEFERPIRKEQLASIGVPENVSDSTVALSIEDGFSEHSFSIMYDLLNKAHVANPAKKYNVRLHLRGVSVINENYMVIDRGWLVSN